MNKNEKLGRALIDADQRDPASLESLARVLAQAGYAHSVDIGGHAVALSPGDMLVVSSESMPSMPNDRAVHLDRLGDFFKQRDIGLAVVPTGSVALLRRPGGNGGLARSLEGMANASLTPSHASQVIDSMISDIMNALGLVSGALVVNAARERSITSDMRMVEALAYERNKALWALRRAATTDEESTHAE